MFDIYHSSSQRVTQIALPVQYPLFTCVAMHINTSRRTSDPQTQKPTQAPLVQNEHVVALSCILTVHTLNLPFFSFIITLPHLLQQLFIAQEEISVKQSTLLHIHVSPSSSEKPRHCDKTKFVPTKHQIVCPSVCYKIIYFDIALLLYWWQAVRYKTGGRGFDSRWGHRNFSVT